LRTILGHDFPEEQSQQLFLFATGNQQRIVEACQPQLKEKRSLSVFRRLVWIDDDFIYGVINSMHRSYVRGLRCFSFMVYFSGPVTVLHGILRDLFF